MLLPPSVSQSLGDTESRAKLHRKLSILALPKTVALARVGLPESNCSVFGASGVHFSVRAVGRTVHWSVVALVHLALGSSVEIVHSNPWVRR